MKRQGSLLAALPITDLPLGSPGASPRGGSHSHAKTVILRFSLVVGGLLMGALAFTALWLGPMRLSDEFHDAVGRCGGGAAAGPDADLFAESPLQRKLDQLQKELDHAQAVAAAQKPRQEMELDRVAILGERNTGTNALELLLRSNLAPDSGIAVQAGLRDIKHFFQSPDDSISRTLILVISRNPYDWTESMRRACYCCEQLNGLSLEDFLAARFGTDKVGPDGGCPADVNPYRPPGAQAFSNAMTARYEKFLGWQHFAQDAAGFESVRIEDLMDAEDQRAWLEVLAQRWRLPLAPDGFAAVTQDARFWREEKEGDEGYFTAESRRAVSFYLTPELLATEAAARYACRAVNARVDGFYEATMGYKVLDCDAGMVKEEKRLTGEGEEPAAAMNGAGK